MVGAPIVEAKPRRVPFDLDPSIAVNSFAHFMAAYTPAQASPHECKGIRETKVGEVRLPIGLEVHLQG